MPWGGRVDRPTSGGFFGQRRSYNARRVVLGRHEVAIDAAMQDRFLLGPAVQIGPFNLSFAKDLYQRVYLSSPTGDSRIARTVSFQAALYSATAGGGGEPPNEGSTWTIVASSSFIGGTNVVHNVKQDPSWFDGLAYVALSIDVYQRSADWTQPFVVTHELWGNGLYWFRGVSEEKQVSGVSSTQESHLVVNTLSRVRP